MFKRSITLSHAHILIAGVGIHGGGAAAIAYCLRKHAKVRVTDLKTRKQLASVLKKFPNMQGTFGAHANADVAWADSIVKNPGVPWDAPFLQYAKKLHKPIVSDIFLFLSAIKKPIDIAITGTRGKSTTTALISHIVSGVQPVFTGGNNRIPVLSNVSAAMHKKVVLELSSWQLEDTQHPFLTPHIAVFTNIYQDHLNRYKNFRAYIHAKTLLFKNQRITDFLVANYDNTIVRNIAKHQKAKRYWFSKTKLPDNLDGAFFQKGDCYFKKRQKVTLILPRKEIPLLGEHNTENILAAIAASVGTRVPFEVIRRRLKTFMPPLGRIEHIATVKGIHFINDTTATSPDALSACISALHAEYPGAHLHMIAGGASKSISYFPLRKYRRAPYLSWYFLSGTATPSLALSVGYKKFQAYTALANAMHDAQKQAKKGDLVVLSPGAASFGMFAHEFDRGDQFNTLVKKMR